MRRDEGRVSLLILLLSLAAIFIGTFTHIPHHILSWDVMGYYLYLPLTFIYRDLGMTDVRIVQELITQYGLSDSFYQAWQANTGYWVIKYTSGEAILLLPFFLIGHLLTLLTGGAPDGFSLLYQYSIFAGCLFYLSGSLWLLRKILLHFFNDRVTAATLLCILLGTNYFITTVSNPASIHLILFFLYTLLLTFTLRWHVQPTAKNMAGLAVAVGLIIITRPTDLVCLLIPGMYNLYSKESRSEKADLLKRHPWQLLMAAIVVAGIGCIQLRYWKFTSGHWFINSYNNPGEGMDFLMPHLGQVLFSFRKGWYLYTPVMLLATAGICFTHQRHREVAWPVTLFFICNLYLVSCWSCWWYADSFGQRAFIQSYPLMAIALGSLIEAAYVAKKRMFRTTIPLLLLLLVLLNLFQSWQYRQGIIHPSRMTRQSYTANFTALKQWPERDKLLLVQRSTDATERIDSSISYQLQASVCLDFEENALDDPLCDTAHSGLHSYRCDSTSLFTPAYEMTYQEITQSEYAWIVITAWVWPTCDTRNNPGSLVVTFNHQGGNYKYRTADLEKLSLKPHRWNKIEMNYLTPEPRRKEDKLMVYYWHRGKEPLYIDDICIKTFIPAK